MKAFKKFILLTIISNAVWILFPILISKGNIKVIIHEHAKLLYYPKLTFFLLLLVYFAINSFSYVYIFERLQQKKEQLVRNLFLAVGSLFVMLLIFNEIILQNNSFSSKNCNDNYYSFICLFFLQYLGMSLLHNFRKSNHFIYNEKKIFYVRLILSISFVLSLFGMNIIYQFVKRYEPTIDFFSIDRLTMYFPKIFWHCLTTTLFSFLLIWNLTRFSWFKKNSLILVIVMFLMHSYFYKFSILVYTNPIHFLEFFFDPSAFSAPLIMFVILYRNQQKEIAAKISKLTSNFSKKEAEYLQLKQQVNPHFLFNNLNTLISFIEIDPKKAIAFGHHLSNTYRHFLKNQNDDFVLLEEELEYIKEYLEIYKAKFENGFLFEVSVVPYENNYILSFSLQEIVDNIFKHNNIDEENPIVITISSVENGLRIENTISNKAGVQSNQVGLANINKRYKILTNKEIQIVENPTIYQITIPILKLEA